MFKWGKKIIERIGDENEWHHSRLQIYQLILCAAVVLIFFIFYNGSFSGVLEVVLGFFIAKISETVIKLFSAAGEDKGKQKESFNYDKEISLATLRMGDCDIPLWYESLCGIYKKDSEVESETYTKPFSEPELKITDDPEKEFELDPFLQMHFSEIIDAHSNSYIKNMMMVRLDDFKKDGESCVLYTSRTAFYNDLVTNRAIDFTFKNQSSVRDIYEFRSRLTPLCESKLSNHIGINAIVFLGDKMLLPKRTANATMSKGQVTSTLAFGLSEKDFSAYQNGILNGDGLKYLLLHKLGELFATGESLEQLETKLRAEFEDAEGSVKITFLGMGRLIYVGGKPQMYYVITISNPDILPKSIVTQNKLDANNKIYAACGLKANKENCYSFDLLVDSNPKKRNCNAEAKYKWVRNVFAEKSFFVNLKYLLDAKDTFEESDGIPSWILELSQK